MIKLLFARGGKLDAGLGFSFVEGLLHHVWLELWQVTVTDNADLGVLNLFGHNSVTRVGDRVV